MSEKGFGPVGSGQLLVPGQLSAPAVVEWVARAQKGELAKVLAAIEARLVKIDVVEQAVRRREAAAEQAAAELGTARITVGDVVRIDYRSGPYAGRSGTVVGFVRGNPQLVHVLTEIGMKHRVPVSRLSRIVSGRAAAV